MVMTDPDRRRRRLSLLLLLVIAVLGGVTMRYAASTTSIARSLKDSDELAGCRALYRADIDVANSNVQSLFLRGLAAAAGDDDAFVAEILTPDADGVSRVDRALQDLDDANAAYADAVERSIADPDAFLAACRRP